MTDYDFGVLCKNIKHLRAQYDYSEEKMANICGVELFELRQLEQGICPLYITVELTVRLYRYFDISPERLFMPSMKRSRYYYS